METITSGCAGTHINIKTTHSETKQKSNIKLYIYAVTLAAL